MSPQDMNIQHVCVSFGCSAAKVWGFDRCSGCHLPWGPSGGLRHSKVRLGFDPFYVWTKLLLRIIYDLSIHRYTYGKPVQGHLNMTLIYHFHGTVEFYYEDREVRMSVESVCNYSFNIQLYSYHYRLSHYLNLFIFFI